MAKQSLITHEKKLNLMQLDLKLIGSNYSYGNDVAKKLQHGQLTAKEIADCIGRELAKGRKKMAIAKAFRKSPAFISQHVTLLNLPDPVAHAFNIGRVKDVTLVNELVTLLKKNPQDVTDWMSCENQEITRSSVKQLREFLAGKGKCEEETSW